MEKKRHIYTIRRGYVEAAIWQYEGKSEGFLDATFKHTYNLGLKRKSTSFGIGELPSLSRLALLAEDFIRQQYGID